MSRGLSKALRRPLIASSLVACFATSAGAQTFGPEFRVDSGFNAGYYTHVASTPGGGYLVVWDGLDGSQRGIWGKRFDGEATAIGSDFQVNTFTAGLQTYPNVAVEPSGRFVVAWHSYRESGLYDYDVLIRAYDEDASPATPAITLGDPGSNSFVPSVAAGSGGDFLVVWAADFDVVGQRFDGAGAALGAPFPLASSVAGRQELPDVAALPDGRFVTAWTDLAGLDGEARGVFARLFSSDGVPAGAQFQVNSFVTGNQTCPRLAVDADGDFLVLWTSFEQDGDRTGIFAQLYDPTPAPVGAEFQVNTVSYEAQTFSDAAFGTDGGFVVVWSRFQPEFAAGEIFARRFAADGTPLSDDFMVNEDFADSQVRPAIAAGEDGNFLVAWGATAGLGINARVQARLLLPDPPPPPPPAPAEIPTLGSAGLAALAIALSALALGTLRRRA